MIVLSQNRTLEIAGIADGEIASIWERLSDFAPSTLPQLVWSAERLQRSGSI